MLFFFVITAGQDIDLDNFALGNSTHSIFASIKGRKVHCRDLTDYEECISPVRDIARSKKVILWLGNSQVHAVNQAKPGDQNAPPLLFNMLREQGYYLITLSQPNANLQEHYLLYEFIKSKIDVDAVILPLVFDDTRETGIRESIAVALEDVETKGQLKNTQVGGLIVDSVGNIKGGDSDLVGLDQTVQGVVERKINSKMDQLVPLWEDRPTIRGRVLVSLYQLRNYLFNIQPTSTRRIIPDRYERNLDSYRAIVESAEREGIKVLSYIVPIRDDVPIPYVLKEYERFKDDVITYANSKDVAIKRYETLIPPELWGTKASTSVDGGQELDFMHFQAPGHAILAKQLFTDVTEYLSN